MCLFTKKQAMDQVNETGKNMEDMGDMEVYRLQVQYFIFYAWCFHIYMYINLLSLLLNLSFFVFTK